MPLPVRSHELLSIPLFQGLSEEQLTLLASSLRRKNAEAGATVLIVGQTGNGIYILLRGAVKICTRQHHGEDERDTMLDIYGPGEVLGEIDALDDEGNIASIVTLEPSQFLWMPALEFKNALKFFPSLSLNLNTILARRIRRLAARDRARTTLDLESRVVRQLLIFAQDYGRESCEGMVLSIRFSQNELAALVSGCRPRVNQVLCKLRDDKYMDRDRSGRYILRNYAQMRDSYREIV